MIVQKIEIVNVPPQRPEPILSVEVSGAVVDREEGSSKAAFRKFTAEAPKLQLEKPRLKTDDVQLEDVLRNLDPHIFVHKAILGQFSEDPELFVNVPRRRKLRKIWEMQNLMQSCMTGQSPV